MLSDAEASQFSINSLQTDIDLSVRDLRFRYDPGESWVLDGLSFDLPPGGQLILAGRSGTGKTTVANLLLRFWEFQEGEILLNGRSVRDYDPDDGLVDWMMTTSKFNGPDRPADMAFGTHSIAEVDELIEQERVETDLEKRKELVQQANQITSDKVAAAFLFHPVDILVYRNEVNYPDVSRIAGLVDLDRTTLE